MVRSGRKRTEQRLHILRTSIVPPALRVPHSAIASGLLAVALCLSARAAQQAAADDKGQPNVDKSQSTAKRETVRDRLWLWGHHAGAHNHQYGLQQDSAVTPAAAAQSLGIRNILMVRYGGVPAPPFGEHARPVAGLDRVVWSVEGAGGDDVDAALGLRQALPNLRGLMMDDYFQRVRPAAAPLPRMWLARNQVTFPVILTLRFAQTLAPDRIELTQSNWKTGDYLSKDFAIDLSPDGTAWQEVAHDTLPAKGGATLSLKLPGSAANALRVRILGTHDTQLALSCGLRRVRVWAGGREVPGTEIRAEASSEYPGHPADSVLTDAPAEHPFSLDALRRLRKRLDAAAPPLDLWVVLYTHEFDMPILQEHLDLCDVVTLWTWRASDLALLDKSMARFEELVGKKRKVLGLYMYDYGTGKPMPVDLMRQQCETGLRWLREKRIEGMILLASCICDLPLEAVEWSRRWIAKVGDEPL